MPEVINVIGLGCAMPVITAKKYLESKKEVIILTDDISHVEKLKVLGRYLNCNVCVRKTEDNLFEVYLGKQVKFFKIEN